MIIFETERLVVRRFTHQDDANTFAMHGNEEVVRYIRPVMDEGENRSFLHRNILLYDTDHPYGRWGVDEKATGAFVGTFVIMPLLNTPHIHLGYALLKPFWGKGYATELTRAGITHAFQIFKLPRLVAVTHKENIASQHVLLKAGFSSAGTIKDSEQEESFLFELFPGEIRSI